MAPTKGLDRPARDRATLGSTALTICRFATGRRVQFVGYATHALNLLAVRIFMVLLYSFSVFAMATMTSSRMAAALPLASGLLQSCSFRACVIVQPFLDFSTQATAEK